MTLRVRLLDGGEDTFEWRESTHEGLGVALEYRYSVDDDEKLFVFETRFERRYTRPTGQDGYWSDWQQTYDRQVAYYRPEQWTSVRNTD